MTHKEEIRHELIKIINDKIEVVNDSIHSAKVSQENDTKSTAGDKHETGRAMLHLEQESNQKQLSKLLLLKQSLLSIDIKSKQTKISTGSLIHTTQGTYFLSIGIGKITVRKKIVLAISLASPIGQQLAEKKNGDTFIFQGKTISITAIE